MINLTREETEQVLKLLDTFDTFNDFTDVREPLRARLSAPEPEPVAWAYRDSSSGNLFGFTAEHYDDEPAKNLVPLYTTPPQREWVGLTDEEMNAAYREAFGLIDSRMVGDQIKFVRAIEAKLREKNGA